MAVWAEVLVSRPVQDDVERERKAKAYCSRVYIPPPKKKKNLTLKPLQGKPVRILQLITKITVNGFEYVA